VVSALQLQLSVALVLTRRVGVVGQQLLSELGARGALLLGGHGLLYGVQALHQQGLHLRHLAGGVSGLGHELAPGVLALIVRA